MLKTAFWQRAANALPPSVRERHLVAIARAERFEILLDGVIDAWLRLKDTFAARRATHQH